MPRVIATAASTGRYERERQDGESLAVGGERRDLADRPPGRASPLRTDDVVGTFHSSVQGRLSTSPDTTDTMVAPSSQAATRHDPPATSVARARTAPTMAHSTIVTGTNAATVASTSVRNAVALTR